MSVPTDAPVTDAPIVPPVTDPAPAEPPVTEPPAEDPDAGAKSALIKERAARKEAEKELAAARIELAAKDKPAEEVALDAARREAAAEATGKANLKILRANLLAVAATQLVDPKDAHLYIDLTNFEVDDDGNADTDALKAAVADLIKTKPHLASGNAPRFNGAGDGGAGAPPKPKESLDDAIDAAVKSRNFALAATLRTQKAAELAKKG
jgi:hypothetical protein